MLDRTKPTLYVSEPTIVAAIQLGEHHILSEVKRAAAHEHHPNKETLPDWAFDQLVAIVGGPVQALRFVTTGAIVRVGDYILADKDNKVTSMRRNDFEASYRSILAGEPGNYGQWGIPDPPIVKDEDLRKYGNPKSTKAMDILMEALSNIRDTGEEKPG